MTKKLVRLKAHDPHRGHVIRRFIYRGIRFDDGAGWYRVDAEVADYLATVRQSVHSPHSPLAFDVCSEPEAKAVDEQEAADEAPRRPAESPREVTPRVEEDADDAPKRRRGRKPKEE